MKKVIVFGVFIFYSFISVPSVSAGCWQIQYPCCNWNEVCGGWGKCHQGECRSWCSTSVYVDDSWSGWGACSASCGGGTQTRSNTTCGGTQTQSCNTQSCCTGSYGSCTAWTTNCGTQTRTCYDTGCGTAQSQTQQGPSCCPATVIVSGTVSANGATGTGVCLDGTTNCSSGNYSFTVSSNTTHTLTPKPVTYYGISPSTAQTVSAVCSNVTGPTFTYAYNCVSTGCSAGSCNSLACGTCSYVNNCGSTLTCNSAGGVGCGTVITSGGPGIVLYGSNLISSDTMTLDPNKVSSKKWRAGTMSSIFNNYKVAGYWDKIINAKSPQTINSGEDINGKMTGGITNFFKAPSGLTISSAQTFNKLGATIVLVNGDLTVNAPVKRTGKKTFPAFFVTGKIIFGTSLAGTAAIPDVDGVFYADGTINVPTANTQLFANGVFIGLGGIYMNRSLGNDANTGNPKLPAEVFSFDPSLIINAPADLMKSSYNWKEVAP